MSQKFITIILPYFLIVFGAILRFLPHPPNFAPISALALFGGVYFDRKYAYLIPLTALIVSDVFIGLYYWPVMISVYGSFLLIGVMARFLRKKLIVSREEEGTKKRVLLLGGTVFCASGIFYLITNWAVWAFGQLYPPTLHGLVQSYLMGLPFFKWTLLGDFFYTTVLFGAYEAAKYLLSIRERKRLFRQSLRQ